eukprot:7622514-Pyramimonas_sp.AAC.1
MQVPLVRAIGIIRGILDKVEGDMWRAHGHRLGVSGERPYLSLAQLWRPFAEQVRATNMADQSDEGRGYTIHLQGGPLVD